MLTSLFQIGLNAVLTLVGGDPIEFGDAAADDTGPDSGTIGPGTEPGTTNGGD